MLAVLEFHKDEIKMALEFVEGNSFYQKIRILFVCVFKVLEKIICVTDLGTTLHFVLIIKLYPRGDTLH